MSTKESDSKTSLNVLDYAPKMEKFPAFPSLNELALGEVTAPPSRQTDSLFSVLIKDPAILHNDMEQYPEKYQEEAIQLVRALLSGETRMEALSPEQLRLLDLATLDFSKQAQKPSAPAQAPPLKKIAAEPSEEENLGAGAEELFESVPITELPDYWWK